MNSSLMAWRALLPTHSSQRQCAVARCQATAPKVLLCLHDIDGAVVSPPRHAIVLHERHDRLRHLCGCLIMRAVPGLETYERDVARRAVRRCVGTIVHAPIQLEPRARLVPAQGVVEALAHEHAPSVGLEELVLGDGHRQLGAAGEHIHRAGVVRVAQDAAAQEVVHGIRVVRIYLHADRLDVGLQVHEERLPTQLEHPRGRRLEGGEHRRTLGSHRRAQREATAALALRRLLLPWQQSAGRVQQHEPQHLRRPHRRRRRRRRVAADRVPCEIVRHAHHLPPEVDHRLLPQILRVRDSGLLGMAEAR
mmetsp:Transcript_14877/g.61905  ORF Transcript_14877/g.61905 Transcript_14877/m.61905 type:complete len:307 (+) Transcript_14877:194-1114(+)